MDSLLTAVPEDTVGTVLLLEPRDLGRRQLELGRSQRILEVPGLRRADDRRGHARLVQEPRQGDLSGRGATLPRHPVEPIDDGAVRRAGAPLVLGRIRFRTARSALAFLRAGADEESARERAPGDHPNALVDALRDHLP